MHLLDELVNLLLQFFDAFFIHSVSCFSHSGSDALGALGLRLRDWSRDFRGSPLSKLGQHLINARCVEMYIAPNLQQSRKWDYSNFFIGNPQNLYYTEKNRWISAVNHMQTHLRIKEQKHQHSIFCQFTDCGKNVEIPKYICWNSLIQRTKITRYDYLLVPSLQMFKSPAEACQTNSLNALKSFGR